MISPQITENTKPETDTVVVIARNLPTETNVKLRTFLVFIVSAVITGMFYYAQWFLFTLSAFGGGLNSMSGRIFTFSPFLIWIVLELLFIFLVKKFVISSKNYLLVGLISILPFIILVSFLTINSVISSRERANDQTSRSQIYTDIYNHVQFLQPKFYFVKDFTGEGKLIVRIPFIVDRELENLRNYNVLSIYRFNFENDPGYTRNLSFHNCSSKVSQTGQPNDIFLNDQFIKPGHYEADLTYLFTGDNNSNCSKTDFDLLINQKFIISKSNLYSSIPFKPKSFIVQGIEDLQSK